MTVRIVVCDDCADDLADIVTILSKCSYKDGCSLKSVHKPEDVLHMLDEGAKVDVIFSDILMPEMSGITLAKKLRSVGFKGFIVFLSATNDYAAQSYEVRAFSYLLKPVQKSKVQNVLDEIEKARSKTDQSGFRLAWRGGGQFILYSELTYVEVQNHHLYFHLHSGEVVKIYGKMLDFTETLLADPRMVYNNRSFIFNMDYITRCENGAVYLKGGSRISVPQCFDEFQKKYFNWMFGKK